MNPTNRQVALITGGAKRIGADIAKHLHNQGFNVIIHYCQSAQAANQLVDELNAQRPNSAIALAANFDVLDDLKTLATAAINQWHRLDVLINNASQFYATPLSSSSEDAWNSLINSNLKAPFFLIQALAPALQKQRGCIINIADIYAEKPLKQHSIYCIAKAGNTMLTKSLALELAPDIRVNGIAPGAILWPAHTSPMPEHDKQRILDKIPLQQCGQTQDIARAVLFLVQDAVYMTGQILTLDGGRSLNI